MTKTKDLIDVTLVYGKRATAHCRAYLTATQIVVVSGDVTCHRREGIRLGGLPYRFQLSSGQEIPYRRGSWGETWRLARGELDRLHAVAKGN